MNAGEVKSQSIKFDACITIKLMKGKALRKHNYPALENSSLGFIKAVHQ